MPFIRIDPEAYDELFDELDPDAIPDGAVTLPSGDFEYEAASGKIVRKKLSAVARILLELLVERGATQFRIRYDGGYDEGFAHADTVIFGETQQSAETVAQELATPANADQIRRAGNAEPHYSYLLAQNPTDKKLIDEALYELAHEIASVLLGDGFGTGEYELYGELTANLQTGEIVDDPTALKPDTRDW